MTDAATDTHDGYERAAVAACREILDSGGTKNLSDRNIARAYAAEVMKIVKPPSPHAFVKRTRDEALADGTVERIATALQEQGYGFRSTFHVYPNPSTVRVPPPEQKPNQVNILE